MNGTRNRLPRWRRTGTEPLTAYSDLRLRLVLSVIFAPLFVAGTVAFAVWAAAAGPDDSPSSAELAWLAVACGVIAVVALVDLVVVVRRIRAAGRR
jgi:heme/copper-type cytochrome/quinol oxidase subunit 2